MINLINKLLPFREKSVIISCLQKQVEELREENGKLQDLNNYLATCLQQEKAIYHFQVGKLEDELKAKTNTESLEKKPIKRDRPKKSN